MAVPTIFLSAATVDLVKWRNLIDTCFERADIHCYTQDRTLPAAEGGTRDKLVATIKKADYVFHLAGFGYGSHADQPFPEAPEFQCSWTQFEYYFSVREGKNLFAFVTGPELSKSGFEEKSTSLEEKNKLANLQEQHRGRVLSGRFEETPLLGTAPRKSTEIAESEGALFAAVTAVVSQLAKTNPHGFGKAETVFQNQLAIIQAQLAGLQAGQKKILGLSWATLSCIVGSILVAVLLKLSAVFQAKGFPERTWKSLLENNEAAHTRMLLEVEQRLNAENQRMQEEIRSILFRRAPNPAPTPMATSQTPELPGPVEQSPALASAFSRFTELDGKNHARERLAAGRELVRLGPGNPRAWFLFGYAAFNAAKETALEPPENRRSLFGEAANAAREAIRLIGETSVQQELLSPAYSNLAGAETELDQAQAAEISARTALTYDKNNSGAWGNLAFAVSLQAPNGPQRRLEILREGNRSIPEDPKIKQALIASLYETLETVSNLSKQLSLIEELTRLGEDQSALLVEKARILSMQDHPEDAESTLNAALEQATTPLQKAEVTLELAKLKSAGPTSENHPEQQNSRDAKVAAVWKLIQEILATNPKDEHAIYLAVLYHSLHSDTAAASQYAQQLPKDSIYRRLALRAELEASRSEFATNFGDPHSLDDSDSLKRSEAVLHRFLRETETRLETAGDQNDKLYGSFFRRAMELYSQQKWVKMQIEAEKYLLTASVETQRSVGHHLLAIAQLRQSDSKAAIENFETGFKLFPGNHGFEPYFAEALDREGRLPEAEQVCREMLRRKPDDENAMNHLADLLGEQKEYAEAVEITEKLLERSPSHNLEKLRSQLSELLRLQAEEEMAHLTAGDSTIPLGEAALSIDRLLARSGKFAGTADDIHAIGDERIRKFVAMRSLPGLAERGRHLIEELRNDPLFPQDCGTLAGLEGWLMYLEARVQELDKSSPESLGAMLDKLRQGASQSAVPFPFLVAIAEVRAALGDGVASLDQLEQAIVHVETDGASNELLGRLHDEALGVLGQIDRLPTGGLSPAVCEAMQRHLLAIIQTEPDPKISAVAWSNIAKLQRLQGEYAASAESNQKSLALDESLYGDWIDLSDAQLRQLRFWPATRSSLMAIRHFPWGDADAYPSVAPLTANFLMGTSPAWLPLVVWFFFRRHQQRRQRSALNGLSDERLIPPLA